MESLEGHWSADRAQRQRDLVDTDRAGVELYVEDGPLVGERWLLAHVDWWLWVVACDWEHDVICTPPGTLPSAVALDAIIGSYGFDRDTEGLRWHPWCGLAPLTWRP